MMERNPINQVSVMPKKIINTYSDSTQKHAPFNIHQPLTNQQQKNQTFQAYLKQKTSGLKPHKGLPNKQFAQVGAEPNSQYSESKPFQKGGRKTFAKSEQKGLENDSSKRQVYDVPSVDKTKTASNNFRHKINRNVIKDTMTENARESTPPSSEQSFRVRLQGGNKKLLQDLTKLNEQQKILQHEIMQLHSETKKQLASTFHKYDIKPSDLNSANFNTSSYQLIGENDSFKNSPKRSKVLKDSAYQNKLDALYHEIQIINKHLEITKSQILKKQAKIESMPLFNYLNFTPDIFEQRESEEENEEVQQLPKNNPKTDPSKTYQSVMTEMRKKKWSVNQRFNYDDSAKMGESPTIDKPVNKDTLVCVEVKQGEEETKIVVNERLKNLLFQ